MLRLDVSRVLAFRAGREFPSPTQILDRMLAKAGLSRRERRQLIAALKDAAVADQETAKGETP